MRHCFKNLPDRRASNRLTLLSDGIQLNHTALFANVTNAADVADLPKMQCCSAGNTDIEALMPITIIYKLWRRKRI